MEISINIAIIIIFCALYFVSVTAGEQFSEIVSPYLTSVKHQKAPGELHSTLCTNFTLSSSLFFPLSPSKAWLQDARKELGQTQEMNNFMPS